MHPERIIRPISFLLLFSISLCCLFFLSLTDCSSGFFETNLIQGGFCAAEQAAAPIAANTNPTQDATTTRLVEFSSNLFVLFVIFVLLKKSFEILLSENIRKRTFSRAGPYQNKFLPYLFPTHGM